MEEFVIVAWPEIQDLMDKEGFNENAFPVLDEKGIEKFGDQSYFVNKNWMSHETIIEIDCPPFTPRPDVYFRKICKNILKCEYYEPQSMTFGNWKWKVSYKDKDQQIKVKEYLTRLYNSKLIRYASW